MFPEAEFPPVDRGLDDGGGGFWVFLPFLDGWDDCPAGDAPDIFDDEFGEASTVFVVPEGVELFLYPPDSLGESSSHMSS